MESPERLFSLSHPLWISLNALKSLDTPFCAASGGGLAKVCLSSLDRNKVSLV